jgi:hypothetical protein
MNITNWKEGEALYCLAAICARGARGLPEDALSSYLQVQAVDAPPPLRDALISASMSVAEGDWERASRELALVILGLMHSLPVP